jgi:hypothetical protein
MNPEHHVSASPMSVGADPVRPGDEPLVDQLMCRVQTLEEEKRRWKFISVVCLALLLLLLVGGSAVMGLAAMSSFGASRWQQERMRALEQAEMQVRMAEQQRALAEQQRQEAERTIQEAERQRAKQKEE